jgi:hypothetical protein
MGENTAIASHLVVQSLDDGSYRCLLFTTGAGGERYICRAKSEGGGQSVELISVQSDRTGRGRKGGREKERETDRQERRKTKREEGT